MANQRTIVVNLPKEKGGDEDDDAADAAVLAASISRAPLFADVAEHGDEVDHIVVERVGPVREGMLGKFEPDATEEDLFNRYGGGKYRLSGRSSRGQTVKGMFKSLEIAGEPIFLSDAARRTYTRMSGKPETAESSSAIGVEQLFAMLSKQNESQDLASTRREAERETQHRRDLERIKAEAEAVAAARLADDERRRKEDRDRDADRRREADERDERRRRDDEAARQRDQQFQTTMLQIANSKNTHAPDPTGLLLAGVELATKLRGGEGGGGGESDPVADLVKNLPGIIDKIAATVKGSGGGAAAAADKPDSLILDGELGKKGQAVVKHLQAQGIDPSQAIAQTFDAILKMTASSPPTAPGGPRRGPGGRPIVPMPAAQPAQPAAQPAQAPAQTAPPPAPAATPPGAS